MIPEPSRSRRQFRLVEDPPAATSPGAVGRSESPESTRWTAISAAQLVDPSTWNERHGHPVDGTVTLEVELPLLLSIARVRSDDDGALALSGLIEGLARRFHVRLPCGSFGDETIRFVAPLDSDIEDMALFLDETLRAQVRETDLAGAMRDRLACRIWPVDRSAQD